MKIIFLDIDGVLNYNGYLEDGTQMQNYGFASELCENLVMLINLTEAKIVISSSWRMYDKINANIIGGSPWTKILESKLGIPGVILGKIGYYNEFRSYYFNEHNILPQARYYDSKYRGYDIKDYIESHPEIEKFVILDDYVSESDIPIVYPNHYVRCKCGMGVDELSKAISILNR